MSRFAKVERETKESRRPRRARARRRPAATEVDTGVPFFDHMLAQLGKHGGFDLIVRTRGDLEVDAHHTVEDTAIALGQALREALGDKAGIRRFGDALVPLDETLVQAAVDLSGRPYLVHERARARRADRQLRHDADPAHLGVVHRERADLPARAGARRAQRPPRRRGAVQGGRPGAARRRGPRRPGHRRPVDQGLAVAPSRRARRRPPLGRLLLRRRHAAVARRPGRPDVPRVRVRTPARPRRRPRRRAGRAAAGRAPRGRRTDPRPVRRRYPARFAPAGGRGVGRGGRRSYATTLPLPRGVKVPVQVADAREALARLRDGICRPRGAGRLRRRADARAPHLGRAVRRGRPGAGSRRLPGRQRGRRAGARVRPRAGGDGGLGVRARRGGRRARGLARPPVRQPGAGRPPGCRCPTAALARRCAGDPVPARVVAGADLARWAAGAAVVTDATAVDSPEPPREVFGRR